MSRLSDSTSFIRCMLVISGAIACGWVGPPIRAQEESTVQQEEETVVVVTGSRIRRIQQEGPSPVVTITAQDMSDRGYQTVLEALKGLSQNSGGGFDQQNTFGLTPSASAIDLRGFGVGRSLVLIDGRRVPVFPLAANGTDNFVDLSSIPAVAVDHIEVLTDGASAIYGSDAISGVVDIILKKHADNELSLRRSDTTGGGGGQDRLQLSTGFDGADGSNAALFLEYYKQDVLRFTDRDYSRSDVFGNLGDFSAYGAPGTLYNASGNTLLAVPAANCSTANGSPGNVGPFCEFNRAAYRELVPDMERYSLTGKYDRPVTDSIAAFARITYLYSSVSTQFEPMALDTSDDLGITLAANAPNNPTNPAVDTGGLYTGQNISGALARRLVEFGPRTATIDNHTIETLAGLRGTLAGGFAWEGALGYSEQRVSELDRGYARVDLLSSLLCGSGGLDANSDCNTGTLNLFDPIPQSVVNELSIEPRINGVSSLSSADFTVNGDLFAMPSGPAKIAFNTELTRQSFDERQDPDVLAGNVLSKGGTAGGGSRKYYAAGVEIELPVFAHFNVNLAGRYDDYHDDSDVGGAFSPRVALEYRPLKTLLLRATAGKSFRAPDLQRLFGAELQGFDNLIDTPTCVAQGGQKGVPLPNTSGFDPCTDSVQDVSVRAGSNRNLTEETGHHFSGGLVWEALAGLTLNADLFYIELKNIVNIPGLQLILDQNAASGAFADAITRTPGSVNGLNPGGLDVVSAQARNLSLQRTRGIDFGGEYRLPAGAMGSLLFGLGGTYIDRLQIRQFPGDALLDVLKDGTLAEEPRLRGNAKVSWTRGPVSATGFLSYIGPFTSADPATQPKVGSWTTVNLTGNYHFAWNGTLEVGVDNLLNRSPPLYYANGDSSQPFYDQSFHDPYGASWFVSYTQKF